ncbi:transcription factor NF-E2 45 kDa subunit [Pelodytes ibericus]
MSPCPPTRAQTSNTLLPTLMGDQYVQGDMDLAWQEILSISELQGLEVQNDPTYSNTGYINQAQNPSFYEYGICQLPDGTIPNISHTIQNYDRPYADTVPAQPHHLPPLAMVPTFGPTAYTGMLISSSITQVDGHCLAKNVSGLMNAPIMEPTSLPSAQIPNVHNLHKVCKGQDDLESDSGLSLNFSDGESMELENMESHRLQTEYMEMLPPLAYQDQYGLLPTLTEQFMSQNSETYSYDTSQEIVCSRDERRATAMNIPFPTAKIVNLPVEDFNELLSRYTLTEAQMALVRDIRRRGKNKVAAQNCRKRKMENISILERDIGLLRTEREGLKREREEVGRIMGDLKKNMELLQQQVVVFLRDQGNHMYQMEDYLLKQTSDNNRFPVPISKETRV